MKKVYFLSLIFSSLLFTTLFTSFREDNPDNPPNGFTGSGSNTCGSCHSGGSFGGSVLITGVPTTIAPSTTYSITVTTTKTTGSTKKAGFQLNVKNGANVVTGTLASVSANVKIESSQYAEHSENSSTQNFISASGTASKAWTFNWTSPATTTNNNINFYVCSVIADNSNDESGDQVVLNTKTGVFSTVVPLTVTQVSKTDVSCFGGNNGTATVSASGGSGCTNSFVWSNGQTGATASGLAAGTYTVTATCGSATGTKSISIVQPTAALAASATGSTLNCVGGTNGTASVSASGGTSPYSYLWSDGQTSSTATGLSAGGYSITITDNKSCSIIRTATVSNPSNPIAATTSSTAATCVTLGTATVTPSNGTSPYSYLWSNGQANSTATGLSPNSYSVTVTDVNGCKATSSATVNDNTTPPSANAGSDTSVDCNMPTTTLIATGGVSYLWSNGMMAASINVSPTVTTTYTVTATGSNGCTASDAVVVQYISCAPILASKVFFNHVDLGTMLMDNYVATLANFPLSDPYAAIPLSNNFVHVNNSTVATISPSVLAVTGNNAIVDWMFLELRTGVSGSTTVAYTKVALLQRDGDIVSTDGVSPVVFTNAPPDNYYLAVRHRNNLGFRTDNTFAFSNIPTVLNFTNNSVALYGSTPLVAVSASIYVMNSGDADPDGSIDAFDTILWENQNGSFDNYSLNADYNLDGSVDAFDTILWELNNGKFQELD